MPLRIQDLYTFHLVARSGSMAAAADQLGVTPGAVSQRIKVVEEKYGLRLFNRSKKGVTLTETGERMWRETRDAFETIEQTHRKYRVGPGVQVVRVSVAPAFAYSILVSSLDAFSVQHPHIKIEIETENRLVDLRTEPVDLAIRHGLGVYPGLRSEWLCAPALVLVASPDLLAKNGVLNGPEDCLRYTLLPDSSGEDWALWLTTMGVNAKNVSYGPAYNDDLLTAKAAVKGQGLALLQDVCVREELADGRLVRALNADWPTQFAYYAVGNPDVWERPSVKTFVRWLVDNSRLSQNS